MSQNDGPPPASEGEGAGSHRGLSRETTPTWEIELIISGAAVFATLGLPRWLDDAWFALEPRLTADWAGPLKHGHGYVKVAALILCVTFLLHLVLRAHWIALVGLYSVYPDWIRWEKLRAGPLLRRLWQARDGGPREVIERADNRATLVFALGWALFFSVMWFALVFLFLLLARAILAATVGLSVSIGPWLAAALFGAILSLAVADALDRRFGARLSPGSRARWLLERVLGAYAAIGSANGGMRIVAVVTSHAGWARVSVATSCLIVVLTAVSIFTSLARREPDRLGSYGLFPSSRSGDLRALDSAHYDDSRDPVTDPAVPFIQSAIVQGPYVRLVVPFEPDRDGAALRRSCPAASAGSPEARRLDQLGCLERLRPLRLDGRPLPVAYDLASDPRTDRPALAAMIDVRGVGPGRHSLEVARAPLGAGGRDADEPHRIPFWR